MLGGVISLQFNNESVSDSEVRPLDCPGKQREYDVNYWDPLPCYMTNF